MEDNKLTVPRWKFLSPPASSFSFAGPDRTRFYTGVRYTSVLHGFNTRSLVGIEFSRFFLPRVGETAPHFLSPFFRTSYRGNNGGERLKLISISNRTEQSSSELWIENYVCGFALVVLALYNDVVVMRLNSISASERFCLLFYTLLSKKFRCMMMIDDLYFLRFSSSTVNPFHYHYEILSFRITILFKRFWNHHRS